MLLSTFGLMTTPSGGMKAFGTKVPKLVTTRTHDLADLVGLAGDERLRKRQVPPFPALADIDSESRRWKVAPAAARR